MLFQNTEKHPHIYEILCGDKTETRRDSKVWRMKIGGIYPVHDAVKGLFQKTEDAICRIVCLYRYEEPLGNISRDSACREGQYTPVEFLELWKEINGYNGLLDYIKIVKVYRFEKLIDGSEDELELECPKCHNHLKVAREDVKLNGRLVNVLYCPVCGVRHDIGGW